MLHLLPTVLSDTGWHVDHHHRTTIAEDMTINRGEERPLIIPTAVDAVVVLLEAGWRIQELVAAEDPSKGRNRITEEGHEARLGDTHLVGIIGFCRFLRQIHLEAITTQPIPAIPNHRQGALQTLQRRMPV